MKKNKIIYWVSTSLTILMGATSAFFYFTESMGEAFRHLGFPDYFKIELAIFKIIGIPLLLIPAVSKTIKEWTYFGYGVVFLSAIIAHSVVDGLVASITPLIPFILLIVSYIYYHKLNKTTK